MNDLEPWKIWAVTGVLAAMIIGTAALRVRPFEVGEAAAQASTLTPDERTPSIAAEAIQPSDQNDAYSPGFSHGSFIGNRYSGAQASMTISLNGSAGPSVQTDRYGQETGLDVSQELVGDEVPTQDMLIANEDQLMGNGSMPVFVSIDDQSNSSDMFTDVPTDHWAYEAVSDINPNETTFNIASVDGNTVLVIGKGSTDDVRVMNVALGNVVLQATVNGLVSNITANLQQSVNYVAGEMPFDRPAPIDQLNTSDILNEAPDPDELRTEAAIMAAKAEAIVWDEAALVEAEQAQAEQSQSQNAANILSKTAAQL